ncbi:sulfatase-like hydrolase/transferase [Halococcus salsus]|uniref:sulfatase-like hydrolase/transferase n=1 Tax=Halococcus salsus TaxID=2162894 RepID=UPI00135B76B5
MNSPPSVVLITVDCLRADHLGCYGYDRPTTPHIDSFADDATVFEYSYANSPGTRWALQSIHTGVHTDQIDGLGVPDDAISLAQVFQQAGYATGGFAKNGFLTRDYRYDVGFDTFVGVSDFESDERLFKRIGTTINNTFENDWLLSNVFGPLYSRLQSVQNQDNDYRPAITDAGACHRKHHVQGCRALEVCPAKPTPCKT